MASPTPTAARVGPARASLHHNLSCPPGAIAGRLIPVSHHMYPDAQLIVPRGDVHYPSDLELLAGPRFNSGLHFPTDESVVRPGIIDAGPAQEPPCAGPASMIPGRTT